MKGAYILGLVGALVLFSSLIYARGDSQMNVYSDISKTLDLGTQRINGTAWFDYDNDGDEDLFVGRLFENENGVFKDVTKESGLSNAQFSQASAAAADFNNDGCIDLYVSRADSPDSLFKNVCDGTFIDVSKEAGISAPLLSAGVAWADYNVDGFVDIYIADVGTPGAQDFSKANPNVLYRNNGDGTFTNVSSQLHIEGVNRCPEPSILDNPRGLRERHEAEQRTSFQPVWFDYNNDALPDLFVATDTLVSPLYKNNGNGSFTDVTEEVGLCKRGTGMGAVVGDIDNNGYLDLYVTNSGANYLWLNDNGMFSERAEDFNINDYGVGWGAVLFDSENDGDLDVYVANARLMEDEYHESPLTHEYDGFYENRGGSSFKEVSYVQFPRFDTPNTAVSTADIDMDGFQELFVSNFVLDTADAAHTLWKGVPTSHNWVQLKLEGTTSNKSAIGARISLISAGKTQIREVASGSSFLSQNSLVQTFGLGKADSIDSILVKWPSGKEQVLTDISVNTRHRVLEE